MAIGGLGVGAQSASADVSPPGCGANNLTLNVFRTPAAAARPGDTVTFTVTAANTGFQACDYTGTTITLTLPGPTGQPNGNVINLTPVPRNFPAGTGETVIGSTSYTVPGGLTNATVQATADGTLHDAPANDAAHIVKTLSTTIIHPHMVLTKVANPVSGVAPLTVTYTYTLRNDGDTPIGSISVTDDQGPSTCSPLAYGSGDANSNAVLDLNETWTYTCVKTFPVAGTYVNVAFATGKSTVDNRDVPAGPATATVVVTTPVVAASPPAPAVPAVPVAAPLAPVKSASPSCVELPKSLTLRAKELTTVKVTVDNGAAGALVRLKGPGINTSGRTNSKGVVTFKVRADRAGTLSVTAADNCLKASRAVVKSARKTQSKQAPKVTG